MRVSALPTITHATTEPPSGRKRKRALVCAGGGITGAVYEVGVLRALSATLPEGALSSSDIVVGVSAGAIVGALIANRVPTEELFNSLAGCARLIDNMRRRDVFRFNWGELMVRAARAPWVAANAALTYARAGVDMTLTDAVMMLGDALPSAFLTNSGIEQFMRRNLSVHGRSNDFRELACELYIPAVNLDTGSRVVFGEPGQRHVPISTAVRASTALPIAFRPVRVNGADYIDGSVEKNFHIDVAVAHGAELVICVNPLVPLMNDPAQVTVPLFYGKTGRYLSEKGLPTIIDQAFKLILHSRMRVGFENAVEQAPHVDIVMFEPDPADYKMFFYNILRYSARIVIAKHGFEAARAIIESNADELQRMLAKYDLTLQRDLLDEAYEQMQGGLTSTVLTLGGRIRSRIGRKEAISRVA